jgi:predicted metal-dependent peptidase
MDPERQKIHKVGDPNCVTLDPAYMGALAFEPLYAWLEQENAKPGQGVLSEKTKDLLKQHDGQSTDAHIMTLDEVSDDMRRQLVEQVSEKCKQLSRGMNMGNLDGVLELLLNPPANNNLRYIRRVISQVKGSMKSPSYARPNRRGSDTKGNKKVGMGLTVIWDWSGSMHDSHEAVASELYRDGYELDIIGADTEVKNVYKVRSKKELAKVPFRGGGGTELMPAIDYVKNPKNRLTHKPLVILTDGYTDALDLSGFPQQVLILTVGQECSIIAGEVKQIKIEA